MSMMITNVAVAIKMISALYQQGLINVETYNSIMAKYA